MYLIFDTETTGLPKRWDAPITDTDNWPRCIQIAWQLHDDMGKLIEHQDYLVKPDGFNIPYDAERIHGISTELAAEKESLWRSFWINSMRHWVKLNSL
jgi:DNA polymerase-3 subunit alpha